MDSLNPETRIIDLTVSQLMAIITATINRAQAPEERAEEKEQAPQKWLVYGIAGIAAAFGCSTTTANRIKKSGVIAPAVRQDGRLIITDAELALSLWNEHKQSSK